jgi:hypothetical protein
MDPHSAAAPAPSPERQLLRHTVATLAYRGRKTLQGAPDTFASFRSCDGARTPGQILAHIGDILDWALSLAYGTHEWHDSTPLPWPREVDRFFAALEAFDGALRSDAPLRCPAEKLFQGPIADALTHVGQLALLRRMAGSPVRGENYYLAGITAGRVGQEQAPPATEFD